MSPSGAGLVVLNVLEKLKKVHSQCSWLDQASVDSSAGSWWLDHDRRGLHDVRRQHHWPVVLGFIIMMPLGLDTRQDVFHCPLQSLALAADTLL